MLTWKDTSSAQGESKDTAFQQLKHCVMTVPMLEIFNNSYNIQYKVYMNTNAKTLGAVLLLKHAMEASFYLVAYFSRKLNYA